MAHFHIKKKNGKSYLYVSENARINGQSRIVSQIYIGCPAKVASLVSASPNNDGFIKMKVEEFGALWLANEIDKEINLVSIIDKLIPPDAREKGPSVGEYFLYATFNRMSDTSSKNKLADWYSKTAIQQIRPTDISELTSERYWKKWDRVKETDLETISKHFFTQIAKTNSESLNSDCLLFDTSNYYTFMASDTKSDLAKTGKNKEGRNNLRQVGLGLLVSRDSKLPLYYSVYPGNVHDSKEFSRIAETMLSQAKSLFQVKTEESLTVVVDKGMNSEDNFAWIDKQPQFHFVTTYSTYFAKELAHLSIDQFKPLKLNKKKSKVVSPEDEMLAVRTKAEYWGKERTVVVTISPKTARKQLFGFEAKLQRIESELTVMKEKVRSKEPSWSKPEQIKSRYQKITKDRHFQSDLFNLEFIQQEDKTFLMSFTKNEAKIEETKVAFGRNIIVTDQHDWSTEEIVQASLDRYQVEEKFRLSKEDDFVAMRPIRHFTDSKIRAHLFSAVVAMTYLRILELKLKAKGIDRSAQDVMTDMANLHSVLLVSSGKMKAYRRIETPTRSQVEIIHAFGYYIDENGVLQPLVG